MQYQKINQYTGILTGSFATVVYLLTMERSGSLWDCGEFLACAARLEVSHAPGAPLFMLIQRLFALPAAFHPEYRAMCINAASALASGLTILFLFWTITFLARKLVAPGTEAPDRRSTWLIMGAGLTGALAYTCSDTFWFSAAEAEVYACSSFFTALVFWAALKWDSVAGQRRADRWLLLIAYLTGLSVGIHLLNLLTIPAVTMIVYFRRCKPSKTGTLLAFATGCGLLGMIQFGMIQYLPILAAGLDLFFVNELGLPYDSGALCFVLLLSASLVWLLYKARRQGRYLLHTAVLCLCFLLLGCSTYTVTLLRSRAETGIDMTNPDNIHSLVAYLQRSQYLQQPLLYGQDYNTPVIGLKDKGPVYRREKEQGNDHYTAVDRRLAYAYDPSRLRFFPRIWDNSDPNKVQFYKDYLDLDAEAVPTNADNLSFFLHYQLNWMWFRYLMWNYCGRQNDLEGQGDAKRGNWITGIKALDRHRTGDSDLLPPALRHNKARNELYGLPFLLGLIGCWFQWRYQRKDALITTLLFFFTGIAIAIYLNMSALQPRERDYAFAGSTYSFAIWIGLGLPAVQQLLQRLFRKQLSPAISISLCLTAVPFLMVAREWDDHDRSRLTLARATAWNVLQSCAPNAILFTQADNDTYPLWYLQEVEGLRPDVRVIITELAGADWYIDQLRRKINQADPVPMIWQPKDYLGSAANYVTYKETPLLPKGRFFPLEELCRFMTSDEDRFKTTGADGQLYNYLPTRQVFVPGPDSSLLSSAGWAPTWDTACITETGMKFLLPKEVLYKNELTVLNIIAGVAAEGWKRPIYFSGAYPGSQQVLGLTPYLHMEGVAYRLLPFRLSEQDEEGSVAVEKSLRLMLQTYQWGGAALPGTHIDEKGRVLLISYRLNACRLADLLSRKGRTSEARQLLDKVCAEIPAHMYPDDISSWYLAASYYEAGATNAAATIARRSADAMAAELQWALSLPENKRASLVADLRQALGMLQLMETGCKQYGDNQSADSIGRLFRQFYPQFSTLLQQ